MKNIELDATWNAAELERVFLAEYSGLCDFAEHYVRESAIAEEVVQEVFLRIWRRARAAQLPQITKAYVYASVRNEALQWLRRDRFDRRWRDRQAASSSTPPVVPTPEGDAGLSELEAAVQAAVASLPTRARLMFELSRNQGLSYAEIAETLGVSVGTVTVQIHRALTRLRRKLGPFLLIALAAVR